MTDQNAPNYSPTADMEHMTAELISTIPPAAAEKLKDAAAAMCILAETLYANKATRASGMILALLISTRLCPLMEHFDEDRGAT